MQIDWITVAAQIANFLVLVWLLSRFLYGPITRAMQAREENIRARLDAAESKRDAADAEAERLRALQAELEARREERLAEVEEEARRKRAALDEELREAARLRRAAWAEELAAERAACLREMRRRSGAHVQDVTRRALDEIAGSDLAPALADRFVGKLRGLDEAALDRLRRTIEDRGGKALVESAPELPAQVRTRVTEALHAVIAPGIEPEYRADGEIGLGMRLTIAEQVVEWSARAWLDEMEEALGDLLEGMGDEMRGDRA